MGALTGRMSPLGFFVNGRVEDWGPVLENLTRYRFQELNPESGRQQSFGWVQLGDPFVSEFSMPEIFFGEHIVGLCLRLDSISLSPAQVSIRLKKRARDHQAQTGKEHVSKAEVSRLKEDLVAELTRKTLPTIKVFEVVYDTKRNRLWFFGRNRGVVQTFLELFFETFKLTLTPDSPYTVAVAELGAEGAERLLELEEARFVPEA